MNDNDKKSEQSTQSANDISPENAMEIMNTIKNNTKKFKGWYFVKTY